jgi:hypothetical protein
MAKFIKHTGLPSLPVLVIFFLFITSCNSLKNEPDFVGTWQFTEKITSNNLVFNTTRTIILKENSYEETYIIQRENSTVISAIIGTRGNLAMTHSKLVFDLKEIGTCALDQSEACTGNVQWYAEGTQYWTDNMTSYQKQKKVIGVFEVTGTSLRLTRDLNNDGDYEDTGEDVIFEMI